MRKIHLTWKTIQNAYRVNIQNSRLFRYRNVRELNLSTSEVHILTGSSFCGLDKLRVLDLTDNPVLSILPNDIFSCTSGIQRLYLSGDPVGGDILLGLNQLEELTLTFKDLPPDQLSRLPRLKV